MHFKTDSNHNRIGTKKRFQIFNLYRISIASHEIESTDHQNKSFLRFSVHLVISTGLDELTTRYFIQGFFFEANQTRLLSETGFFVTETSIKAARLFLV